MTESTEWLQARAMVISKIIRDAMEDFHHEHLSDAQMRELNPIIRNAVFTALTAIKDSEQDIFAGCLFVNWAHAKVPAFWETPELLESYAGLVESYGGMTSAEIVEAASRELGDSGNGR